MMHGEPDEQEESKRRTGANPRILFCPYCRDGFEALSECPEHELTLVPIDRLPRALRSQSGVAFFLDPRLGRGPILLGCLLVLVGFFVPFVRTETLEASALEVAIDGAHNLWLVPVAAVSMLAVLWLRRERLSMHAARLAVLGLAVAGSLPLLYTSRRIAITASATQTEIDWRFGGPLILMGLALGAIGSLRLGVVRFDEPR